MKKLLVFTLIVSLFAATTAAFAYDPGADAQGHYNWVVETSGDTNFDTQYPGARTWAEEYAAAKNALENLTGDAATNYEAATADLTDDEVEKFEETVAEAVAGSDKSVAEVLVMAAEIAETSNKVTDATKTAVAPAVKEKAADAAPASVKAKSSTAEVKTFADLGTAITITSPDASTKNELLKSAASGDTPLPVPQITITAQETDTIVPLTYIASYADEFDGVKTMRFYSDFPTTSTDNMWFTFVSGDDTITLSNGDELTAANTPATGATIILNLFIAAGGVNVTAADGSNMAIVGEADTTTPTPTPQPGDDDDFVSFTSGDAPTVTADMRSQLNLNRLVALATITPAETGIVRAGPYTFSNSFVGKTNFKVYFVPVVDDASVNEALAGNEIEGSLYSSSTSATALTAIPASGYVSPNSNLTAGQAYGVYVGYNADGSLGGSGGGCVAGTSAAALALAVLGFVATKRKSA